MTENIDCSKAAEHAAKADVQAEPVAGNNAAWAEGFSAGESWRQDVVTFWETNDYGKSPAQPVNPYPAIAPQATQPGADALDAERWRMLPAFYEEYQIDGMKLMRDIDAAMAAAQEGGNVAKGDN